MALQLRDNTNCSSLQLRALIFPWRSGGKLGRAPVPHAEYLRLQFSRLLMLHVHCTAHNTPCTPWAPEGSRGWGTVTSVDTNSGIGSWHQSLISFDACHIASSVLQKKSYKMNRQYSVLVHLSRRHLVWKSPEKTCILFIIQTTESSCHRGTFINFVFELWRNLQKKFGSRHYT